MMAAITNVPPKYNGTLNLKQVATALAQTGGNKAAAARAMSVPISTFKRAAAHLKSVAISNNIAITAPPSLVACTGCGEQITAKSAIYLDASNNRSDKPLCQRCYEGNIRAPTRPKHIVCMPQGPYSVADRRRRGTYTDIGIGFYD